MEYHVINLFAMKNSIIKKNIKRKNMINQENKGYFEDGSGLEYFKVYKDMLNHYGVIPSMVFSVIANYSKYAMSGDKRCCTKSEVAIGNELQLSWSSVRKAIKLLLKDKLIEKVNKSQMTLEEKLNSANWYRPVSKNIYQLKNKEKKTYLKTNYQRQRYQETGREKIKENIKEKEKEEENKKGKENNDGNNDEYSW